MNRVVLLGAVLTLSCTNTVRGPSRAPLTTREIVDKSKPAIVRVESQFSNGQRGVGTGFVVGSRGRIVTNLHVISDGQLGPAGKVVITLLDGTQHNVVRLIGADPKRDLALVSIVTRKKLPTLDVGDSDVVSAGDRVIAIGNPLGVLDYTVSDGLISSVRSMTAELTMLQISAPISVGSSGGPLLNRYGEVIGVATAISREGQNLNFGIPSNYLRPLLGKHKGIPYQEFSSRGQRQVEAAHGTAKARQIKRRIPRHELSVLDGCSDESLIEVYKAIGEAIKIGAPLYNLQTDQGYEACFRVYEGAALRLEHELACPGLREALGHGLLRAGTIKSFKAKAWAMRDAFDGVVVVIDRKASGR